MNEQDRFTTAPSSACSTNPMHISFAVTRHIVVDHVADSLHVQTSSRHVGGHHDIQLAPLEVFNNSFALGLSDVAIQSGCSVTARTEVLTQWFCRRLQFDENDHAIDRFCFENSAQSGFLLILTDDYKTLTNRVGGCSLLANRDFGGILQMLLSNSANRFRHRG